MEEQLRAELVSKVKKLNTVKAALVLAVSVLGLVLAIVNLVSAKFLFTIGYLIAGSLGAAYSAIEINQTYVPLIEVSEETLNLRTWDNGFLPYNIDFKPKFFQDFIPSKMVIHEIPVSDITEIAVGSKGFLIKSVMSIELNEIFSDISNRAPRTDNIMKRFDIMSVKLKDGTVYAMNVKNFDKNALYEIVDFIEHRVAEFDFKTNIRVLRKMRETTGNV
ncbi:MAG: hypothetical protein Q4B31_04730 [Clostridia bacterium]|nr:hypothetical protein [Clostridia bacterium]